MAEIVACVLVFSIPPLYFLNQSSFSIWKHLPLLRPKPRSFLGHSSPLLLFQLLLGWYDLEQYDLHSSRRISLHYGMESMTINPSYRWKFTRDYYTLIEYPKYILTIKFYPVPVEKISKSRSSLKSQIHPQAHVDASYLWIKAIFCLILNKLVEMCWTYRYHLPSILPS